ncbi:PDZ domain-containing protein [Pedobacter sp. HDW13]|uniref:PDZ domain-containing protein n=1 Tax=Pedobacter sp. HDW13 TaxID=2714940 RepID=UPI001408A144|nr:right-handed parallel beta-helix repeat-containing protein [Pedobacter sp. HDW13]QIL40302.1 PDZ domain-containing protein [Pedobacter sp. HDW13]
MKRLTTCLLALFVFSFCQGQTLFVSPAGNNKNLGTARQPIKTLEYAIESALKQKGKDVVIELASGVYSPQKTITISGASYHLKSLNITAAKGAKVTISASAKNKLIWKSYKDNIYSAQIDFETAPDQLFMNGENLPMARYPNYDPQARVFKGTAADAIAPARVKTWANPENGYIHALHAGEWGGFHYQITGKSKTGELNYEGGWQNNRPAKMHAKYRFVENIFEELDAPGEWFYNRKSKTLFLIPPTGTDINQANFTFSRLTDLIHIKGDLKSPVKNISINGIDFTETARSFMLGKEPLLRSDWTIYRGGAILLEGTENISIRNCNFYNLGGNAVFLSKYNKNDKISNNHIYNIGASALAFVGDPDAVRSPAFRYEQFIPWDKMDFEAGPKSDNFPQHCEAINNLINNIGTIEKQSAGVEISMSQNILVSHNTIYEVPRAGINVSEGTWGGHIIEFNDVFDTVLETGDHGAFNSWGRDRFWRPERKLMDSIVAARPGIELLDITAPIVLRNNRFQCDHGWDIDLDDGSSNYQIYNNICLSGGLKLREGYHRTVYNNIIINNTFHPHVWLKNSGDVFKNNIVTTAYAPIQIDYWGKEVNHNFFLSADALAKTQQAKIDANSTAGNALFENEKTGDFRLRSGSPALAIGFKNFAMNFGVTDPRLKKLSKSPKIMPLITTVSANRSVQGEWLGATVKNIENLGERSAAGIHNDNGALLVEIKKGSIAEKNLFKKGDVIVNLDQNPINSVADLLKLHNAVKWKGHATVLIMRDQQEKKIEISLKD